MKIGCIVKGVLSMEDKNYNGLNNHDELINEEKNNGTVD